MEIKIIKRTVSVNPDRKISEEWVYEQPQQLESMFGVGDVPGWLLTVFGWGKFGKWFEKKSRNIRKYLGWLSVEETLLVQLVAEIKGTVDKDTFNAIMSGRKSLTEAYTEKRNAR